MKTKWPLVQERLWDLENAMGLPMYGVDLHPAKVILICQLN